MAILASSTCPYLYLYLYKSRKCGKKHAEEKENKEERKIVKTLEVHVDIRQPDQHQTVQGNERER